MTIQIRHGVFETNSSSSHSLTMRYGDLSSMPFSETQLRNGVVEVEPGSFQWEWKRYYTAAGKCSYLLTQAANQDISAFITAREGKDEWDDGYESDEDFTLRLCQKNKSVAMLRRVIEEATGCAMVVRPGTDSWIGIDHESVGNGMQVFKDEEELSRFLFDPTSYIETGNDNSKEPARIECDEGGSELYSHVRRIDPVIVEMRRRGPGGL